MRELDYSPKPVAAIRLCELLGGAEVVLEVGAEPGRVGAVGAAGTPHTEKK